MYPERILNGLATPEQGIALAVILLAIGIALMYVGWRRMHEEQYVMQEVPQHEQIIELWMHRKAS